MTREGRTPIYKDGEVKYIRDGMYEPVWKPAGWSLEPPRRMRRRPRPTAPVAAPTPPQPDLPMPRPRASQEPPPGLTMNMTLNLTPARLGILLAGAVGGTVTVGVALHLI